MGQPIRNAMPVWKDQVIKVHVVTFYFIKTVKKQGVIPTSLRAANLTPGPQIK